MPLRHLGEIALLMQKDYVDRHEEGGAIVDPTKFLQRNVVHFDLVPNGQPVTDRLTLHPTSAAARLPEVGFYHTRFNENGRAVQAINPKDWRKKYKDICDHADERHGGADGWRWHPKVFYICSEPCSNLKIKARTN